MIEVKTEDRPMPLTQPAWHARLNPFLACAMVGFAVATLFSQLLVLRLGLSPRVQLVCGIAAAVGLLGTALAAKLLTGKDGFVFYRDAIVALLFVALVLRLLHRPVLPYLDVTILGAGLFQAFGRIGCLLVGCCHGRPARFGLRYSQRHAQTGFPTYLVGVRLFPIQAVEAFCVFALVFAGSAALISVPPPVAGSVTAAYALIYAFARFWIEFFRGDVVRPVYAEFSQAQWISLALSLAILLLGLARVLPSAGWHALVPLVIAAAMLGVRIHRKLSRSGDFSIHRPQHVRELADFLARRPATISQSTVPPSVPFPSVSLLTTTAGLRLSSAEILLPDRRVVAVTFSRPAMPLLPREARQIAAILSRLASCPSSGELLPASAGIFHALLPVSQNSVAPANLTASPTS